MSVAAHRAREMNMGNLILMLVSGAMVVNEAMRKAAEREDRISRNQTHIFGVDWRTGAKKRDMIPHNFILNNRERKRFQAHKENHTLLLIYYVPLRAFSWCFGTFLPVCLVILRICLTSFRELSLAVCIHI